LAPGGAGHRRLCLSGVECHGCGRASKFSRKLRCRRPLHHRERGNITEELYTSRAAIDAAKNGEPLPSGRVIALVDYRDGKLFRYVVMEKRTGWGASYPSTLRNGEWEFQSFNPDKSVKADGQPDRCMSCHKSQEHQDFVWTVDQLRSAE
jgi:hypothetical protein